MRSAAISVATLFFVVTACSEAPAPPAERSPAASPEFTARPPNKEVYALAKCNKSSNRKELAENLVAAEVGLRSDGTTEKEAEQLARLQQTAYGQLVRDHPEWRTDVLNAIQDADIRRIVEENLEAGTSLYDLTPAGELPKDWVIKPPLPADQLRALYDAAEEETGVKWYYLAAINLVESRMGRIDGRSPAGARGPMQFTEPTWEEWGSGNIRDPRDAIPAAARYLEAYGALIDIADALRQYNPSDRYVTAVSNYARIMKDDERAYLGYYNWQVFNKTKQGTALLYVGWPQPIDEETRQALCGD